MAKKNKGGRPSVYSTKIEPYLRQIAAMRELGISHDDIYPMLNIGRSTYYKHKSQIDEFVDAIKIGDEELVRSGKASLKKLVDGYERTTTTYEYKYEYETHEDMLKGNGVKVLVKKNEKIEQMPPTPSSVYFALVNKTNGEFRHRQDVVVEQTEIPVQKSFRDLLLGNEDVEEQTDL